MYKWNFRVLNQENSIDDEIVKNIQNIFINGFGLKNGWNKKSIETRLLNSTILGLLTNKTNEIFGYVIYDIPKKLFENKHFLWTSSMCIVKELQGKGFSKQAFKDLNHFIKSNNEYKNYQFGWIGGRTQNPIVIKKYQQYERIYPFNFTYESSEGQKIIEYIINNINEIKHVQHLTLKYGICHKVYNSGKLGDYSVNIKTMNELEKQLKNWGFNRNNGDSIIVTSQL